MKDESNAPAHDPQSAILNLQSLISLSVALLALVLRLIPDARTIDDAYITFRYARNIVNGVGFVYNAGEYVLGTTTPLYTLLMAALSFILRSQNFPAIALWVNALADAIACVLLIALGETLSGQKRVGVAAAFLYAVAPFSVTFAIGGMETSIFVLLIILTAILYLRRHPAFAFCAALALLTRPDALIFILPLFAFQFVESILHTLRENREDAKGA
jgi:Gpi18-like mannosyltransferase